MDNTLKSLSSPENPSSSPRRLLIASIVLVTLLLVFFLIDIFYIQFPLVTRTGDAQLQRWIGPDAVKLAAIMLALLFGACYLIAAIRGTRERETAPAWKLGTGAGASAGTFILLLYLLTSLNPTSMDQLLIPVLTLYGLALLGTLVVGFLARAKTGWISSGTIAGFWFGVLLAMVASIGILLRDALFAQHLAATVWPTDQPGDLLCRHVKGTVLISCEVGDDIGLIANTLLTLPLLGLLLGTLAATIRHLFTRPQTGRIAHWSPALVTPLICTCCLLIIFIIEALWNLW